MKKLVLAILLISAFSAQATESLICTTVADSNKEITYKIKITSKQIIMAEKGESGEITIWNLEYPGLFSYYGADVNGVQQVGHYKEIKTVLFDIEEGITLADLANDTEFKMRISFAINNLDFDDGMLISVDYFACKKQ